MMGVVLCKRETSYAVCAGLVCSRMCIRGSFCTARIIGEAGSGVTTDRGRAVDLST